MLVQLMAYIILSIFCQDTFCQIGGRVVDRQMGYRKRRVPWATRSSLSPGGPRRPVRRRTHRQSWAKRTAPLTAVSTQRPSRLRSRSKRRPYIPQPRLRQNRDYSSWQHSWW